MFSFHQKYKHNQELLIYRPVEDVSKPKLSPMEAAKQALAAKVYADQFLGSSAVLCIIILCCHL